MEVLLAKKRILKLIQAWDEKQIELWSLPELLPQLLNDSRTIDEMLKQHEQVANLAVQKEQEEQAAQSFTPYWNFSMIDDEEVLQSREKFMKAIQTFFQKFSRYSFGVMPKWNLPTFYNDEEHSIQYKEYLENSSNAITTVLPTEELEYSLSIRYENLSTTPKTGSDEVIKSSVEKLVPIQSEYEGIFNNTCDVPVCEDSSTFDVLKDHSEILSDFNNDDISSDDDAFEDIEYVEASLPDSEFVSLEEENDVYQEEKEFDLEDILQIPDIILREKLLSINRVIANIEFLNDNPTPNHVLKSSSSFPIFKKSDNSLSYSDNSLPEFKTFSDHTEETRSGSTTAHANNSPLGYDSFCFETEPDQGRLTSVVMNDISDNSTNDPLLEDVDLFLASDNSISPSIENFTMTRKGISIFLKNCLAMIPFPFPKMSHLTLIIMMIRHFLVLLRNHRMLIFSSSMIKVRIWQKSQRKEPKPDKNEQEIMKSIQKPDPKIFSAQKHSWQNGALLLAKMRVRDQEVAHQFLKNYTKINGKETHHEEKRIATLAIRVSSQNDLTAQIQDEEKNLEGIAVINRGFLAQWRINNQNSKSSSFKSLSEYIQGINSQIVERTTRIFVLCIILATSQESDARKLPLSLKYVVESYLDEEEPTEDSIDSLHGIHNVSDEEEPTQDEYIEDEPMEEEPKEDESKENFLRRMQVKNPRKTKFMG
uniref:Uncharacterized protein n=1 Tax=Tanacetum cinerariifolium TaxID=118510 RepID=A0A6L2KHE5_TANCI|nr:hypothetical protein [Tanacetum cinerariifolium]